MKASYTAHLLLLIAASVAIGLATRSALLPDTSRWCPLYVTLSSLALIYAAWWLYRARRRHVKKVLFMLDAIENNDYTLRFPVDSRNEEDHLVHQALNRTASILHEVKKETVQQEKYYELILECVETGILVLDDRGDIYQKNRKAMQLLGMEVLTHIRQLERMDCQLAALLEGCRAGDKFQVSFSNERGTTTLAVRASSIVIHDKPLRVISLDDINHELDDKEVDSWIKLTRVLTHEIMNSVTPIVSISDTLQNMDDGLRDEVRQGLQAIATTGKSLLSFAESYRQFSHIPTPVPTFFYVKDFVARMVDVVGHQHPSLPVVFNTNIHPDNLMLHADENLTTQVFINILKNAMQAIESDTSLREGHICIRAYCNEAENVLIEISNNGPAIPEEVASHIFVPFFTTKEEGSGVGLSISRQIMRLSGGSLSLLSHAKETTFVLAFY